MCSFGRPLAQSTYTLCLIILLFSLYVGFHSSLTLVVLACSADKDKFPLLFTEISRRIALVIKRSPPIHSKPRGSKGKVADDKTFMS